MAWSLPRLHNATRAGVMNRSVAAAVVVAFFVVVSLIFVHLRLCKPMAELTTTIKQIVAGQQNLEIPCATRLDETGEIARELLTFRNNVTLIYRLPPDPHKPNNRPSQQSER